MLKSCAVPLTLGILILHASCGAAQDPPKKAKGRTLDEMMLFFPFKHPVGNWKPGGLDFADVTFQADDGTKLHGWFCPCKNPRAVILYAHGNAGNLTFDAGLMKQLQKELRVSVLVFDYRGYGKSEGEPTVEGVLKDARAARKFLAAQAKVKESAIVLMGRSLGGAVAVQLAGETRPRGLILESTFSSLQDVAAHHYGGLAVMVPKDRLNSVAQLARYDGPLLQSHGDADRVIPFALAMKLFQAAKGPKEFFRIKGGDHNDRQPAEYFRKLDQFIGNLQEKEKKKDPEASLAWKRLLPVDQQKEVKVEIDKKVTDMGIKFSEWRWLDRDTKTAMVAYVSCDKGDLDEGLLLYRCLTAKGNVTGGGGFPNQVLKMGKKDLCLVLASGGANSKVEIRLNDRKSK